MSEITELQSRRAVNTIWNGAHDYGFQPDFKAYDADGNAELYWNLLLGALRRHYEYPKLRRLFDAFAKEIFGGNPAGVVCIPQGVDFPTEEIMQKTAASNFCKGKSAWIIRPDIPVYIKLDAEPTWRV